MYFFLPGDDLLTIDMDDNGRSDNQPLAFTLHERGYDCFDKIGKAFYLQGYGVEWDGAEYVRYSLRRLIPKFQGTKNINELMCSVLTDEKKILLQARGMLYASLSGIHYKTYRNKRVMIDRRAFDDPDGYLLDPDQTVPEVEQSRLHLLAPHVYGFNLGSKKWMTFIVTELKDVVFDEDAWEHLVLEQKTKDLIRALVEVSRNSNSNKKIISDVISGKGGGLISVLHGPPGTGKTLTAEGVAELLKRPLYMVGATELSLTPHEMERSLKGVLSLATAWDAVLLVDEADVFLEARSLHELDRNALVSVALRVLEYHKGVLFLTTNRISSFDDAFLSRFSIAIKYPPLEKDRRLIVWRRFFELAGCSVDHESERVTEADLDWLASKPFNGRTVKNLVRTAQSLALSRNESLSADHVRTVVEVQEKFLSEFAQISSETVATA
ncbi:P-loop containing nucleoside triphosphate hydrolase protein [Stereum hirsutum FP-91666 SS1]|uniref:P-loop containing nucleoside triphosphate hydrolase protein n=1 Tax=Stereum hirsutum (strain FP-91666) TaxID=721885 RepID=UPI000444A2C0|nr:P-loop containing nucleoside triphosphate hydrolase protein [Stereum hirsutum FP-91666 SS1]EIM84116.1 P-loop containing nucleoside triphosphate hydrolase protein [Stereum hirsutum FP-91666 SS1]